jgi:hypothetical protein
MAHHGWCIVLPRQAAPRSTSFAVSEGEVAFWRGLFGVDAAIYVSLASLCLLLVTLSSPRLLRNSYPEALKAVVPPLTREERVTGRWLALPFLLVLAGYPIYAAVRFQGASGLLARWAYTAGITSAFNLWDWLIVDWLVICAITPAWVVIPGTARHPAYQDYRFHFRGFLKGIPFSAALGLVAAAIAMAIRTP